MVHTLAQDQQDQQDQVPQRAATHRDWTYPWTTVSTPDPYDPSEGPRDAVEALIEESHYCPTGTWTSDWTDGLGDVPQVSSVVDPLTEDPSDTASDQRIPNERIQSDSNSESETESDSDGSLTDEEPSLTSWTDYKQMEEGVEDTDTRMRQDESDGGWYTKDQFFEYYGSDRIWDAMHPEKQLRRWTIESIFHNYGHLSKAKLELFLDEVLNTYK